MPFHPVVVQAVYEGGRTTVAIDFRCAAESLQKQDEIIVASNNLVGHVVRLVVGRQSLAL